MTKTINEFATKQNSIIWTLRTVSNVEIVIVSLFRIDADEHCFQVNHIDGMGTNHSHKTEGVTYS